MKTQTMKEIQITLARLNLSNLIAKYILKAKTSDLSDLNRETVLRHAEELESALETLKMLESENRQLFKVITQMQVEKLELEKRLQKDEQLEI